MKNSKAKKPFVIKQNLKYILGVLPLVPTAAFSEGIDYIWTGSTDTDFRTETNWSPDYVDDWNDNLIINTSTPGQSPVLTIDDGSSGKPSIENGNHLIIGTGNNANGSLSVNFTDNASTSYVRSIDVGVNGGTGTLNITRNENVTEYWSYSGLKTDTGYDIGTDGYGTLLGSGSGSHGTINVLGTGKATDQQRDGQAQLTTHSMKVGENQGYGELNVSGAAADIGSMGSTHDQANFVVGDNSTGMVNVLNGGKLTVNMYNNYLPENGVLDHIVIGSNGGEGTVNISGKSAKGDTSRATFGTGMALGKGVDAKGALNVTNGGYLTTLEGQTYDSTLGEYFYTKTQMGMDQGTGSALVSGDGSVWQVAGQGSVMMTGMPSTEGHLYVGGENQGTGNLTINNGGKVTLGQIEYENVYEYDPDTGSSKHYYQEKEFIGGLGTVHLAESAGSTGTINIGSAEGVAATGAGSLDAKDIIFGDGTGTIVFNHTDTTGGYIFDQYDDNGTIRDVNQLVGNGTLKTLNGVTVLNTDQSTFTGKVYASGGVLEVNNVLGGTVEVNGSGTLAGVGTIGETTVKSGGTLSPGKHNDTSASALTVNGNLNMNAGSTLAVNIGANLNAGGVYGESDIVNVLGTANISGAKVYVNKLAGSYILDTRWNILNATGGVNGTFGDLLQNRPFVSLGYEYDANNAYLVATRTATGYCVDGMSYNQCSVGRNIDGQGNGSLINNIIAAQSSIEDAEKAFDLLSGEIHASAQTAALEDSRFLREAMNNRLQDTGKTGAWAHAFGSWGDFDGDGNSADMKRDIAGVFFGADAAINENWQLGVVGGYSRADIKVDQRQSSADRDDYHIGAYTGAKFGQAALRAGVGHTFHKYSTSRNVEIEGLSDHLTADYDANTTQVYAEGSYQAQVGQTTSLEPFVNMAYVNHQTDGFTESGDIARLSGGDDSFDMLYSTVGTRVVTNIKLDNSSNLKAWGMLGWRHAYNSVTPDMRLNFQGEGGFNVKGTPIARDVAAIEFGVEAEVTPMVKVGVMYNGQIGNGVSDNGVKAYLNWLF